MAVMDLIEEPADIRIVVVFCGDTVGKLCAVLDQRGDYLLLAEIAGSALQESQMKNDAFKIQSMLQICLDAMKDAWIYNENIASFHPEDLAVQANHSHAVFNVDDLHLVMPVIIERMEDDTVIGVGLYR